MDVRVKFLGGAGTVTGSKYLLEINDYNLMIDCGLFQGPREIRTRNWDDFPIDPGTIDAVVLTHAHLDHSGYLPRLFKNGYAGKVHCTIASCDLVELLLKDSAKLQEEEAEWAKKKGYSRHSDPKPLYDSDDVELVLPNLIGHDFHERFALTDEISINFKNAGHILGASIVEVFLKGKRQSKKLVFSGDLGRYNDPILYTPDPVKQTDILFVESTYGDRANPYEYPMEDFQRIFSETFDRGGVVVIPAFSIGRTQNILYFLNELFKKKMIPPVNVYMDSPMAISATELYVKHHIFHKLNFAQMEEDNTFLDLRKNLKIINSHQDSVALNMIEKDAIIISASGMMQGGRIMHHLYNRLPNYNDTLIVVGYQAEGTKGREILEGAESVSIFGQDVKVNCNVEFTEGLSAHADQDELMKWISCIQKAPKKTFLIHGEPDKTKAFKKKIEETLDWNVEIPNYLESSILFSGI